MLQTKNSLTKVDFKVYDICDDHSLNKFITIHKPASTTNKVTASR